MVCMKRARICTPPPNPPLHTHIHTPEKIEPLTLTHTSITYTHLSTTKNVAVEDYPYRTYAYHAKTDKPTPDGTYIVLNNDPNGPAEIEYGAYLCAVVGVGDVMWGIESAQQQPTDRHPAYIPSYLPPKPKKNHPPNNKLQIINKTPQKRHGIFRARPHGPLLPGGARRRRGGPAGQDPAQGNCAGK